MKGQLTCEFKFATFSCRVRRQYQQDNEERDYSCQLQDALEPAVRMVSLSQYHAYTLLIILLNTVGIMVHLSLSLILLICLFQDKFPKAQVNVYVTVLQNDGSRKYKFVLLMVKIDQKSEHMTVAYKHS